MKIVLPEYISKKIDFDSIRLYSHKIVSSGLGSREPDICYCGLFKKDSKNGDDINSDYEPDFIIILEHITNFDKSILYSLWEEQCLYGADLAGRLKKNILKSTIIPLKTMLELLTVVVHQKGEHAPLSSINDNIKPDEDTLQGINFPIILVNLSSYQSKDFEKDPNCFLYFWLVQGQHNEKDPKKHCDKIAEILKYSITDMQNNILGQSISYLLYINQISFKDYIEKAFSKFFGKKEVHMLVDAAVGTFEELFTAKGARDTLIEVILDFLSTKSDKINLNKKLIDNIKSFDDQNKLRKLIHLAASTDSVSTFAKELNL